MKDPWTGVASGLSCPTCGLRTDLRSSVRVVCSLNYWVISPAPNFFLYMVEFSLLYNVITLSHRCKVQNSPTYATFDFNVKSQMVNFPSDLMRN